MTFPDSEAREEALNASCTPVKSGNISPTSWVLKCVNALGLYTFWEERVRWVDGDCACRGYQASRYTADGCGECAGP